MNVTRPGVDSSMARLLPRLQRTIYQCESFVFDIYTLLIYNPDSRNITIHNSHAFVRRDDPSYASLPPDSRKHPAPIDPSSKISNIRVLVLANARKVSKWFYISSAQV